MAQFDFNVQVPCTILSLTELPEPMAQTRRINGKEEPTNRLDFTHVMIVEPDFEGITDLTPERKALIAAKSKLYLTAYDMEQIRLQLQARSYSAVCAFLSHSSGNVATVTYSEYITGTEYTNPKGEKFSFKPTETYPIGSTRYNIELPKNFLTISSELRRDLLAIQLREQADFVRDTNAAEQSALNETRALLKRRRELARLAAQAKADAAAVPPDGDPLTSPTEPPTSPTTGPTGKN